MGWNITLMPYGSAHRARRKIFHQHFGLEALKPYREQQLSEVHKLLKNLTRHKSSTDWFTDTKL